MKSIDRLYNSVLATAAVLDPFGKIDFTLRPDSSNDSGEMVSTDDHALELRAHDFPGIGRHSRMTTYSLTVISGGGSDHDSPPPDVEIRDGLTLRDAVMGFLAAQYAGKIAAAYRSQLPTPLAASTARRPSWSICEETAMEPRNDTRGAGYRRF
jgi:hypothetical protein